MSETEYDDFFDGVGGGAPSFKFNNIGDSVAGEIVDQFKTQQTKFGDPNTKLFFDDGKPRMQLNVTLQTTLRDWAGCAKIPTGDDGQPLPASEDDGKRRIYIKNDMVKAVARAIQSAKQTGGLKNGGKLAVKKTGEKDTNKGNPMPLFEAVYKAPVVSASDEFFGDQPSAPSAPQSAPPAAPAATPTWSDEPPF